MSQEKAPHVVYIITKLELGGAQKVCLALMDGVQKRFTTASLISGAQGQLVSEAQKFSSVYFLKDFKREVGIKTVLSEVRNFIQMIRILRRLKKQHGSIIVHTHSTKAGIVGRWAAFFARIPYRVHTIHGYGFHDFQSAIPWIAIYVLEFVTSLITTHFVCVSERDRLIGIRKFPRFARKSSVIRAAVDEQKFLTARAIECVPSGTIDFRKQPCVIGTISCFKQQKNIIDLLKAFKQVFQSITAQGFAQPRLQLIGDGELRSDIERWIVQENLSDYVDVLGWQGNVEQWLRSWHLFALSSLWEGLPCAAVEARLSSLPVVAYDVGGIYEVISDHKNGYLVRPGDWQGLASAIERIIINPVLYGQLRSYNDHLQDFYTSTMIQQHAILYNTFPFKNRHF